MTGFPRFNLPERLKGAIALALLLFAVLVLFGSPASPPVSAEAVPSAGAVGPYHTLDAL